MPPVTASMPLPPMVPAKVPLALTRASVLLPRSTLPLPDRLWIAAPALAAAMLKAPLSITLPDAAMLPLPDSARVAPLPIVVAPV